MKAERVKSKIKRVLRREASAPAPTPAPADKREARRLKALAALQREMAIDAERQAKYAIPAGGPGRFGWMRSMRLDASATRLYHRVEKGFSLPEPRRPFGAAAIGGLGRVLENKYTDHDALYATESRAVLAALESWNERGERVDDVAPRGDSLPTNPLDAATTAHFITSRRSIRDFAPTPVDHDLISESVRIAMSAPSVCNRQSWRAYWFDAPEDLARILPIHRGSAGFADRIPGIFVVTFDIRAFEGANERNQGWIDSGLFAMNLMLAVHGLGLGAVPLNWSRSNMASDKMRAAAAIPPYENIAMLIAVGHPNPGYRVARSARRPIEQVLRFGMPSK